MTTGSLAPGQSVTVAVPATSANLGPGFDSFGLALDWRDRSTLEVTSAGYEVEVTGAGADSIPRDATHLVVRSALHGLADLKVSAPGLRLTAHNTIPHGRGLGSSSAAIVAGLLAARALAGFDPDEAWLLKHASQLEGHPDNVAAAIYGGLTVAYGGDGFAVQPIPVHAAIGALAYVPEQPLATALARSLLPDVVPHADAAANTAFAALLVHAFSTAPDLLFAATEDRLHQLYRSSAMPASYAWMQQLRARGFAAVISGAGPTVLVLGAAAELERLEVSVPEGFVPHRLSVGAGAKVAT